MEAILIELVRSYEILMLAKVEYTNVKGLMTAEAKHQDK